MNGLFSPNRQHPERLVGFGTQLVRIVDEGPDRSVLVVVAVRPQAVDASGADAARLHAFQLPLVGAAVAATPTFQVSMLHYALRILSLLFGVRSYLMM